MNDLQIFKSQEFGTIRTTEIDGEPYFVGKDIAEALGYAKPENALAAHVDDEDKTTTLIQGTGSNYKTNATVINEEKINEAIVNIRMAQAVIEFAMESGKFESDIVLADMHDQSDGLDHVAQLLMDIRDGKEDK